MAEVSLRGVWKVYEGGVEAVREVDIEIPDGAFCVLVGPSGCGKSTTLRMVAGLEEISRGTITIGGRVVNDVAPKDRDIAMVFQNYALYPHMTVEKNLSFALRLRKTPKDEINRRVGEAARMLGLTDYLHRKPGALSGGQRQRVALGRAMVREPSAFLFDEPLSNLDAKLRGSTRAELKALHQRLRTTTMYVTHDQEEAMSVADGMAVFEQGRIRQTGTPEELYRHPNSTYVAGMLGAPAMNVVPMALASQMQVAAAPARADSLGVRPENLRVTPGDTAEITEVEPLGGFTTLELNLSGTKLRASLRGQPKFTAGERVSLTVDPGRAHFFDAGGAALAAN